MDDSDSILIRRESRALVGILEVWTIVDVEGHDRMVGNNGIIVGEGWVYGNVPEVHGSKGDVAVLRIGVKVVHVPKEIHDVQVDKMIYLTNVQTIEEVETTFARNIKVDIRMDIDSM